MAVDFNQLKAMLGRNPRPIPVIVNERSVQQLDGRWKYPIQIVEKVIDDNGQKEVIVRNVDDGSSSLLEEKDLQGKHLVEISLSYKDRLIRELRNQGNQGEGLAFKLLLEICRKAAEKDVGIARYMKEIPEWGEISPEVMKKVISQISEALEDKELSKKTKSFLQETLERDARVDPRLRLDKRFVR